MAKEDVEVTIDLDALDAELDAVEEKVKVTLTKSRELLADARSVLELVRRIRSEFEP